jgi:hypothetical protein
MLSLVISLPNRFRCQTSLYIGSNEFEPMPTLGWIERDVLFPGFENIHILRKAQNPIAGNGAGFPLCAEDFPSSKPIIMWWS